MSHRQSFGGGSIKRNSDSAIPVDGEGEFHALVDTTLSPIICTDQDGRIAYWNLGAVKLFGYEIDEAIGQPTAKLYPETSGSGGAVLVDLFTPDDGSAQVYGDCTLPMRRSDGAIVYVEMSRSPWRQGDRRLLTITLRDISERREWEQRVKRRVLHEQAVAKIASRMVGPGDLDTAVEESLADVGRLCRADRAYIFLFNDTGETMSNTHEWCEAGVVTVKADLQNVPTEAFPWTMAQVRLGLTVPVPETAKLPSKASAERHYLEQSGVKSLLFLPVKISGSAVGFLGIANIEEAHAWAEHEIMLLEACVSIIGDALYSRIAEQKLVASEERARRLFDSSPIALWQIDYSSIIERFDQLRKEGVNDFRRYLDENPEAIIELTAMLNPDPPK